MPEWALVIIGSTVGAGAVLFIWLLAVNRQLKRASHSHGFGERHGMG